MVRETGEVLAGMFRAGDAGANCAAAHVVVLAAAIEPLPEGWRTGHQPGDHSLAVCAGWVARGGTPPP